MTEKSDPNSSDYFAKNLYNDDRLIPIDQNMLHLCFLKKNDLCTIPRKENAIVKKHMAVEIEFFPLKLKLNISICLAMLPIIDGQDISGANQFRDKI